MTPTHSRDRNLLADLDEQLLFLTNSCATYDGGFQPEAKRIAVVIRTLVHDTTPKNGRSLLEQLGVKTVLSWNDSAPEIDPRNVASTTGLTAMGMGAGGIEFVPRAGQYLRNSPNLRTVPFAEWWTRNVIKDANKMFFTRRDLVLALANRDGGAHIDRLKESTFALAHENSSGFIRRSSNSPTGEAVPSPIFPSVRTIAEELTTTLEDHRQAIVETWVART